MHREVIRKMSKLEKIELVMYLLEDLEKELNELYLRYRIANALINVRIAYQLALKFGKNNGRG